MAEMNMKCNGSPVVAPVDFSNMSISIPNPNGSPTSGVLAPAASPRKTSLGSFDLSYDEDIDNDSDVIPSPLQSMETVGSPEPLALPMNAFPSTSPCKSHTMLNKKTLCKGRLYTNSAASMSLRRSGKVTQKHSRMIYHSKQLHQEASTSLRSIQDHRKSLRCKRRHRRNEPLSASAITAAFFRAAAERRKSAVSSSRFVDALPELADAKN